MHNGIINGKSIRFAEGWHEIKGGDYFLLVSAISNRWEGFQSEDVSKRMDAYCFVLATICEIEGCETVEDRLAFILSLNKDVVLNVLNICNWTIKDPEVELTITIKDETFIIPNLDASTVEKWKDYWRIINDELGEADHLAAAMAVFCRKYASEDIDYNEYKRREELFKTECNGIHYFSFSFFLISLIRSYGVHSFSFSRWYREAVMIISAPSRWHGIPLFMKLQNKASLWTRVKKAIQLNRP